MVLKFERSLYQLLQYWSERLPDEEAISAGGLRVTFSELHRNVNASSCSLEEIATAGDRIVGISSPNGMVFPTFTVACSKIGAVVIPIAGELSIDQLEAVISKAQIHIWVITKAFLAKAEKVLSKLTFRPTLLVVKDQNDVTPVECVIGTIIAERPRLRFPKKCFMVNFTSGSTGTPKPICVSEEVKLKRIHATQQAFNISQQDRVLVATPQYHSLGFRQSLLPVVLGCSVTIMAKFTATSWLSHVLEHNISWVMLVSSQLGSITESLSPEQLSQIKTLRSVVSSSAPFSPRLRSLCLERLKFDVYETYGLSELGTVTAKKIIDGECEEMGIGSPLADVEIALISLTDEGVIDEDGCVGEIGVKSACEFLGYGDEDLRDERFHCHSYFLTGDLGARMLSGEIAFKGRKKDIIKVSGVTVFPKDIEDAAIKFSFITEAAVFSVCDALTNEKIVLCYTSTIEIDEDELYRFLFDALSSWQIPSMVRRIETIPRNALGKIDKARLETEFYLDKEI